MKLTDILSNNGGDDFRNLWNSTKPADDFEPLPPGVYIAHAEKGELKCGAEGKDPYYRVTFRVVEGEYSGRLFWHYCGLGNDALKYTKRDLLKFEIRSLEKLDEPLPKFYRCRCHVVVKENDQGRRWNKVKSFDVLGLDGIEDDPFRPSEPPKDGDPKTAESDRTEPTEGGDCVPF